LVFFFFFPVICRQYLKKRKEKGCGAGFESLILFCIFIKTGNREKKNERKSERKKKKKNGGRNFFFLKKNTSQIHVARAKIKWSP
jgi:hypothetical protein